MARRCFDLVHISKVWEYKDSTKFFKQGTFTSFFTDCKFKIKIIIGGNSISIVHDEENYILRQQGLEFRQIGLLMHAWYLYLSLLKSIERSLAWTEKKLRILRLEPSKEWNKIVRSNTETYLTQILQINWSLLKNSLSLWKISFPSTMRWYFELSEGWVLLI